MRWMIYGANGYTGELIARNARGQGLKPILAGRREAKVAPLAEQEGLEYRVFSLDDPDTLADELADVDLVLHCAGPFSRTSRAMLEGCLKARTHYLDITGEVAVFEHVFAQAARVEQAGIIACPGVGFDVIPTDCVAARLKEALPDARELSLGFSTRSGLSPGTAKTLVEGLADGGRALLRRLDKMSRPVTGGGRDSTPYTCWTAPSFTAHHGMCVSAACFYADATFLVEGARSAKAASARA